MLSATRICFDIIRNWIADSPVAIRARRARRADPGAKFGALQFLNYLAIIINDL